MADSKLRSANSSGREKRSTYVPLSPSNVMEAVREVERWWGYPKLAYWLCIPQSKQDEIRRNFPDEMEQKRQAISYWINTDPLASWRRLIRALDESEETKVADSIRSNAEPLTDDSLIPHTLLHAVSTVKRFWGSGVDDGLLWCLGVPVPVIDQIKASQLYLSEDEKRMAGLQYCLQTVPDISWGRIAGVLWEMEEYTVLETVRQHLPPKHDPSLSPSNLTSALDSLPDKEWRWFGRLMDVPRSILNKIESQFHTDRERKTEVLRVCSTEHPQPTWQQVSDVLYQLSEGRYHSVLDRVQSQFPTAPLSEERAQQIIDKALESSSVKLRNVVGVLTGLMGSGKTWLLCRLFNQIPPSFYASTGIAEQSFRSLLHHLGSMSAQSWELFSSRHILEFLALVFREQLPPADIARLAARIASIETSDAANPPSSPSSSSSPATASSSATSPSPPAPTPSPKPATPATESNTSRSMVSLVKAPKSSGRVPMLELLHMIDTGGQPEFMENMPSYVHNCHLVVLVLNLMFGLDEYPPVYYHDEKGKAYKRALPSQHTNRQIIQKVASTLQANRFSRKAGQCFRLLAIATHRDCVAESELPTRIKAFHGALKAILLPACDDELILYSENEIPFVLNLKEPDTDDLAKLALIREKISESGVGEEVEVPGSFLIFEQELVEFAKQQAKRDILNLAECLQVGVKLKMKPEVVEAALILFHRQITLLYFRHVLPNVVFTKPQLPLDVINSIVKFSYKVASGEVKGIKPIVAKYLRDGIVTEEILCHDLLLKCFVPNLYEPRHAIDLMCHNFTLAPLSHDPQSKTGSSPAVPPNPSTPIKREYLMMSLRPAILDKDIPQYIPAPSEIAPLVVKFSKDCVPLSCFSSTISCLLCMYDWKLSRADNGSPECLAHNVVSLFKPATPGQIILVDVGHSIQIHIHTDRDTERTDFPEICFQVKETVFTAIKQVFDRLQLTGIEISPAFICPCPNEPNSHSASGFLFKKRWFLHCSKTEKSVGAAFEHHTMWLDTPVTEKEKPSLPKLLELKVHENVGTNYRQLGTFLLKDTNGCLVDVIEKDCQGKCHDITRKILQNW